MNDSEKLLALSASYKALKAEIHKVIIGQEEVVDQVLISMFSGGHCLLIGVPGLAKTLLVNTISSALGIESRNFKFIQGPLFTNMVLADEINRTPPKTQSALLEAMQERRVTAAGTSYVLPKPFFVLATQNPIEQEGTYPLPEAQLDRFMFNVWVDYPVYEDELIIVKATTSDSTITVNPVISGAEILDYQSLIRRSPVADNVLEYAVKLVAKTRINSPYVHELTKKYITWGAGPRASQYLVLGAKCHAALNGKFSPDIEDVKAVAAPILRHRLVRNYKAEADGFSMEKIIASLL